MNEEREIERKILKINEDKLFEFLVNHPHIFYSMRYQKAAKVFHSQVLWLKVPERFRRNIFMSALKKRSQNEKDAARTLSEKNQEYIIKLINENDTFKSNVKLTTKWKEFLEMCETYANDNNDSTLTSYDIKITIILDLLNNEKMDILSGFEEYIRNLENVHKQIINDIFNILIEMAKKGRKYQKNGIQIIT